MGKSTVPYLAMKGLTNDQITTLLETLSSEELLVLIERIAQRLRQIEEGHPQPLYGIWKGKFSADVDIEDDLRDIRSRWKIDVEEPPTSA